MPARCFLAIGLTPAVLGALEDARLAFLDEAPDWAGEKWVAPELLHVTLKFIGPLADEVVPEAIGRLAGACEAVDAPRLRLEGVRAVPSTRRTNMLWASFADADAGTRRLHRAVDEVLAEAFGVAGDERPFHPHTTLLRTRQPRRAPEPALAAAQERLEAVPEADRLMSVPSFTLLASTLGPGGPTYEIVGEVRLG